MLIKEIIELRIDDKIYGSRYMTVRLKKEKPDQIINA